MVSVICALIPTCLVCSINMCNLIAAVSSTITSMAFPYLERQSLISLCNSGLLLVYRVTGIAQCMSCTAYVHGYKNSHYVTEHPSIVLFIALLLPFLFMRSIIVMRQYK